MRPERQDGTSGGGLLVPMDWMYAEYVADGMLRTGDLMEPSTLEYRAGRDALALTVFLSSGAVPGALPASRLDELSLLTAYGAAWCGWVRERFEALDAAREAGADGPDPDLLLARVAWRWLRETELLAADLDAIGAPPPDLPTERPGPRDAAQDAAQVWTPAWQLGLPLGHLAIHLH
ncbi:hypothetical protein ACFVWY_09935 [Streptomyces sp. NPDC058195]|uniref:hypothetical protein n=1 Tax=Streptomyces sp. NPDC058195 TaxID=3346375 RepID=UPI0036E142C7